MKGVPSEITKQSRLGHFLDYAPKGTIYWNFETFGEQIETKWNAGCCDVSKEKVHKCMEKAFGYSQKINPENYIGTYVEKSNLQAKHDGKLLGKPKKSEEGKVYEKYLNTGDVGHYTEWRLFYFQGVKFALLKYKPINDRFGFKADYTVYFEPLQGFTEEEVSNIDKFCQLFGVDLCELDIMKDQKGNPYIIDVNNMAGGTDDNKIFRICQNKSYDYLC